MKGKKLLGALLMLGMLLIGKAQAEDIVWALVTEDGRTLTQVCYEPEKGDLYIAGDNRQYTVIAVEDGQATLREDGTVTLPDVRWLDADAAQPVNAAGGRRAALYCTHSDESYKPSDGTYSDAKRGSIYQVTHALGDAFEALGVTTEVSDALHHPHDAGAYRRSRQTAVQLLRQQPDAIFDIHRDGIPDPEQYAVTIGGEKLSKVRILVGRGNQYMESNKQFALQLKAVADKVHPGLIKDIYMGKGTYNQDLAPHALLFECGTYTLEKKRVLATMPMLAEVTVKALYGGIVGSAGTTDTQGSMQTEKGGVVQGEPDAAPGVADSGKGTGKGILWVVGIFAVGLAVYAFAATGSGKGAWHKAERNISEMTGGLIGKKPEDKQGNE